MQLGKEGAEGGDEVRVVFVESVEFEHHAVDGCLSHRRVQQSLLDEVGEHGNPLEHLVFGSFEVDSQEGLEEDNGLRSS